jgi:hypothetical protein
VEGLIFQVDEDDMEVNWVVPVGSFSLAVVL